MSNTVLKTLAAAAASSVLLAACGGKPSIGDMKDALNNDLGKPLCWTLSDNEHRTFPTVIPAQEFVDNGIRRGVIRSGFVKATYDPGGIKLELLPAGVDAHVFDPKQGFCVGEREVVDVLSVKQVSNDPDDGTFVTYTWKMKDVPSWVKPDKFTELQDHGGLTTPVKVEDELLTKDKKTGEWVIQHG